MQKGSDDFCFTFFNNFSSDVLFFHSLADIVDDHSQHQKDEDEEYGYSCNHACLMAVF